MDSFKEIFDALNSRVRSPIFGSISIAFIVFNWKALFFLTFANTTASERIHFFDDHTTLWSTLFLPIAIGLAFAIASPWIALFSTWAAEEPTMRRKIRQTKSSDKVLTEKLRLEQTRIQFLATEEKALIEAAKRDEEVQDIRDDNIRENLQKQIDEVRNPHIKTGRGKELADVLLEWVEHARLSDTTPENVKVYDSLEHLAQMSKSIKK